MASIAIESLFHESTATACHVVAAGGEAAIVDPALDYEPANGRTGTGFADALLAAAAGMGAKLRWVLETHLHADHLSAGDYLRQKTGANIAIGAEAPALQAIFAPKFGAADVEPNGGDFDLLVKDGDRFPLGAETFTVWHTPGHTRGCVTYLIGDAAFVGDTVFMPDYGTARTDFVTGDAATLLRSIARIHALPDATKLYLCHDYRGPGRTHTEMVTTVAASKHNVHLVEHPTESDFVAFREAKNKTLGPPRLIAASIQVNIRAGRMPPPEADGRVYLRIPVNGL